MIATHDQLSRLAATRIVVLGDLILDHYIRGTTERTSPEAPVPVVLCQNEELIPGGAANVARNVRAIGAEVACIGVVGDDSQADTLISNLEILGADCSGVIRVGGRPTTTKTRVISQNQQMLRLDREHTSAIPEAAVEAIVESCKKAIKNCQAIIVSDYAKGVLTPQILESIIGLAREKGIPLFVDPKGRDYSRYRGAYALTPNAREAFEASGFSTANPEGLSAAASIIIKNAECDMLVITRGAEGLAMFRGNSEPLLVPTAAREVFDVTGAGDTFVAFLAMAVAAKFDAEDAARIANAAAGVVVGKSGAATVTLAELRGSMSPLALGRKMRSPEELEELGNELRTAGKRVVFTNGCFDFIHPGHVAFLQEARALGDVLVLATNTDDVIEGLKGAPRPIIKQGQREKLLAAIEAVDYIVSFPDQTPHKLIKALRPDVLVKGSNYTLEQVEGHEIVESYGGKVMQLGLLHDISTNDLLAPKR